MAPTKTQLQQIANHYSENGTRQHLILFYTDHILILFQVHQETAKKLTGIIEKLQPVYMLETTAYSADGLTFAAVVTPHNVERETLIPHFMTILTATRTKMKIDEDLSYKDQRMSDCHKLEYFQKMIAETEKTK